MVGTMFTPTLWMRMLRLTHPKDSSQGHTISLVGVTAHSRIPSILVIRTVNV